MPKFIREGRMGPPMSYKTGAVVGTYPRPLLHLGGDPHGIDIIPLAPPKPSAYKMEVCQQHVTKLTPELFLSEKWCEKPRDQLSPITHVNFYNNNSPLSDVYGPRPDSKNFPSFNLTGNALIAKCPWRTVVVDPVTQLSEIIYGHLAIMQPGQMADPRKWAASIGQKVMQTISSFNRIQAHVVFIMHCETKENETTNKVSTTPMIYSKSREAVAGLFAQFLYAEVRNSKPIVLTQPTGYCTGIGMRWPLGLPAECGAHFEDLYGAAIKAGELER